MTHHLRSGSRLFYLLALKKSLDSVVFPMDFQIMDMQTVVLRKSRQIGFHYFNNWVYLAISLIQRAGTDKIHILTDLVEITRESGDGSLCYRFL